MTTITDDYGHTIKECGSLRGQIQAMIRQGELRKYVKTEKTEKKEKMIGNVIQKEGTAMSKARLISHSLKD